MARDIQAEIEKIWNTKLKEKDIVEYLCAWSGIDEELILYAAHLTFNSITKPSLPYMHAIIENWERKGIKTVDEAKARNKTYEEKKKNNSVVGNNKNVKSNNESISKAELLAFIRDIQEDMPKYMQSKAEKAGFVNACCQIASYLEHK